MSTHRRRCEADCGNARHRYLVGVAADFHDLLLELAVFAESSGAMLNASPGQFCQRLDTRSSPQAGKATTKQLRPYSVTAQRAGWLCGGCAAGCAAGKIL
jgi:hypothetical protein